MRFRLRAMRRSAREVVSQSIAVVSRPRAIDLTARAVPSAPRDVDPLSNAVSYL